MDLSVFMEVNTWMALLTLTFLEIVLGIDNIVFISIVTGKLDRKDQPKARNIGLILAMIFRIIMLFGISKVLELSEPFLYIRWSWFQADISWQSVIILVGGIFLLYKSVSEIDHKLEGEPESVKTKKSGGITNAIIQIALLNLVFSFDSILTAIGMVSLDPPPAGFGYQAGLLIMILAVVISIIIMIVFAGPVSDFVNKHPSIQILGLSFLILIGVMLMAEGSHVAHFRFFNNLEVTSIPKGYLYFAIAFSLFVEWLNISMRKKSDPVKLHDSTIEDEELRDDELFN